MSVSDNRQRAHHVLVGDNRERALSHRAPAARRDTAGPDGGGDGGVPPALPARGGGPPPHPHLPPGDPHRGRAQGENQEGAGPPDPQGTHHSENHKRKNQEGLEPLANPQRYRVTQNWDLGMDWTEPQPPPTPLPSWKSLIQARI